MTTAAATDPGSVAPGTGQSAAASSYSQDMVRAGVPEPVAATASEFLGALDSQNLSAAADHGYDLSQFAFADDELPVVNALGAKLKAKGHSQDDVARLYRWYKSQPEIATRDAAAYREAERADLEDVQRAKDWLRGTYGNEADANLRLLRRYVAGLTVKERQALAIERNADGVAALNDPKRLRDLIALARGGGNAAKLSPAEERAEIERVMREERTRYNRDERMQARYRDLLRG